MVHLSGILWKPEGKNWLIRGNQKIPMAKMMIDISNTLLPGEQQVNRDSVRITKNHVWLKVGNLFMNLLIDIWGNGAAG